MEEKKIQSDKQRSKRVENALRYAVEVHQVLDLIRYNLISMEQFTENIENIFDSWKKIK